jgi:hypothetical protein
MEWPDGSEYEGEWLNDARLKGSLIMPDKNKYIGEFRNDKFHGIGKIEYLREQLSFEGLFENGFSSKIGKITYFNNSSVYIGEVDNLLK